MPNRAEQKHLQNQIALDTLAYVLNRDPWDLDMLDTIAEILREAGHTIMQPKDHT